ncbi:CRISPR-associated endoribonuclease Cas6 [Thermoanaerobacterium thermosaccharolyticum]|uniref:CRISPR-associated endoribonuclease Cas6 n=1 Tax=Thermoanaerobacterium thermosaccharolyticum TaxID=1517 RepID=UPI00123849DF|nr:CRISPR-associated endoribonuclease Cas6 [Thermoanaerobacterium thermosaccharolyticum]KAA5805909.1 CRISPR-associated endoribonuclease Cas6 [Thermoanaerobacterium thermosaccharolyticum]
MRVMLEFIGDKDLHLPIQYNHIVQGLIYNNMTDGDFSAFMHDEGFKHGKRKFKLFTYSRLEGEFRLLKKEEKIVLKPPFRLTISSPIDEFIFDISQNMFKKDFCTFNNQTFQLSSINIENPPVFRDRARIKFLSPVVMYSTIEDKGIKYTYYYSPWNDNFSDLLLNNLIKKYEVIYGEGVRDPYFKLYPIGRENMKYQKVMKYKNTVIKGWMGIYDVECNPDLLKVAYYSGLGAKNSQGFGCFEIL